MIYQVAIVNSIRLNQQPSWWSKLCCAGERVQSCGYNNLSPAPLRLGSGSLEFTDPPASPCGLAWRAGFTERDFLF